MVMEREQKIRSIAFKFCSGVMSKGKTMAMVKEIEEALKLPQVEPSVEVTFNNAENNYEAETIVVTANGCTTKEQADRLGRFMLATEKTDEQH